MALAPSVLISQLSNSQASSQDRIAAGRRIKNELIGGPEHKETYVRHGLVDVLSRVLSPEVDRHEDEELQAVDLLRSLVKGGPEYATPILASSIISHLRQLVPPSSNPHTIIIATLRLLVDLAQTSRYASPTAESFQQSAAIDTLYSDSFLQSLAEILSQSNYSTEAEEEISLTCRLISKTCKNESQQAALTAAGILDCLATKIASYHAYEQARRLNTATLPGFLFPPGSQEIAAILNAVIAVVSGSEYRSARFLLSPMMNLVFPLHQPELFHLAPASMSLESIRAQGLNVNHLEYELPRIDPQMKSETKTFTGPFSSFGSVKAKKTAMIFDFMQESYNNGTSAAGDTAKVPQSESSFIAWLLVTFRSSRGKLKLRTASLLASLRQEGQTSKFRDRLIAEVMVTVLKTMLEDALKQSVSKKGPATRIPGLKHSDVLEHVPTIMAKLTKGKTSLSSMAAANMGIAQASTLLKTSYGQVLTGKAAWEAIPSSEDTAMIDDMPATRRLGTPGLNKNYIHYMRRREAALRMIASLADDDDIYRKQFLAEPNSLGTLLKDSLLPFNQGQYNASLTSRHSDTFNPAVIGHDVPVLIAACEAIRMFSRSVTMLRTNLLESGMAKHVVSLLRHADANVSRVATEVCVNIANEFSPMREELCKDEQNITLLCEHAHSADSTISLISLMALKNLCNKAPHNIKVRAFEKLETGWLIKTLRGRPARPVGRVPSLNMGGNAAGERVSILNATIPEDFVDLGTDDTSTPFDDPHSASIRVDEFAVHETLLGRLIGLSSPSFDPVAVITQYKTQVNRLHEYLQNIAASEAYADELMLQAGGFDFIRNLTLGDDHVQMLNIVFREIGDAALFDILYSKLKSPASSSGATGGVPLGPSARARAPHPACTAIEAPASRALLTSVLGVLMHIAAGTNSQRQQLISNRALVLALQPLLDHSDPDIRVSVVWIIINLTFVDSPSDISSTTLTSSRVQHLKSMGWQEKMKDMTLSDESANVRDRASAAYVQLKGTAEGLVRRAGDPSSISSWGSTRG